MLHRLMRLTARHPLFVDAVLATAVGVASVLVDVFGHDHRTSTAVLWDVLLAAPLVVRRRTPIVAATLIGAVCLLQWLSGDLASGDLVVLVMLYTLGVRERRLWVLGAAVLVAEVGVVMAVGRWDPDQRPWLSVLLLSGTVTASWVLGCYVRMRRDYIASMVERAETAERDRDARARVAVADERARMAREMHDIIAHSLSVMITLNDAVAAVAQDESLRDTASQASDVGRQALSEMQRMLGVLRNGDDAELAPQPGTAQLSDLVAIVRSAGPAVTLSVTGDPSAIGASAELAVYRIVQESLTNILKHAVNVTQVDVELTYESGRVAVCVRNDGDPVDVVHASPIARADGGGHGLTGMRERAQLFGGRIDAGPAPSGGWAVRAELPLTESAVLG